MMSGQTTPRRCRDCRGILIAGMLFRECRISTNGGPFFTEYRCELCAEDFAVACWDWEDRGPYPGTITRVKQYRLI